MQDRAEGEVIVKSVAIRLLPLFHWPSLSSKLRRRQMKLVQKMILTIIELDTLYSLFKIIEPVAQKEDSLSEKSVYSGK